MSELRRSLDRYSGANSNHLNMDTKSEFMREVRDNFLLCKLCNKDFDRPKTLPCMHSFCMTCLLTYADEQADDTRQTYRYTTYSKPLNCPICRKRTDVTKNDIESLPDNFLISSLSGIIRDKAKDTSTCDICSRRGKGRKPSAVQKCLECDKQLCKRCVVLHQDTKVTAHHSLFSLENADRLMCAEHEEEAVRFICKTCAKCVCVFCTYTTHKGHDLVSILEGTENYQHEMEKTMENCNKRMVNISNKLHFIRTWEECYNQTRDHILTTATNFLTQVESQRQSFLDHLDKLYGPEMLDILSKKEELIENLEGLSSACKYKDVISEENSLEAVLIQSELQNKVRQLLDTPLSLPDELPDNDNVSISFEKGGVRLGTLIKQNGDEEPIYFDGDDEDDSSSWCRQCRARSRSISLDKEAPGLGLQKRLLGNLSHSLTPFKSDTDLSLTDVSALDNMSPQLIRLDSQITNSVASDLDQICETAEFGVQVQMNLVESVTTYSIECTDAETQYEQSTCETSMPALVDSSSQHDIVYRDSCNQYEPSVVSAACQYENLTLKDSSTQNEILTEEASSQYESNTTSSSTQHEVNLQDSSCQPDTVLVDSSAQYEISTRHSSTQSPLKLYHNASSQHEVTYADFSAMHQPSTLDKSLGTPLKCSSDSYTMTAVYCYSETGVDVQTDLKHPGVDNSTCTDRLQHTDIGVGDNSVCAIEIATMTDHLISQKSQSTSTVPLDVKDKFVNTEAKVTVERGSAAYCNSGYSRSTQTSTLLKTDSSTNTPEQVKLICGETNTVPVPQAHQYVQTNSLKLKSRGINVKPNIKDFGIDIKPSVLHVSTKTDGPNTTQHETQTAIKTYSHTTCNTSPVHNKSRGVMVHIAGVSKSTNTQAKSGSSHSSTQTVRSVIDSSCGDDDVFAPEKEVKTSADALCGSDIPIFSLETSSTNTRLLETASASVGTSISTRDGWCYPKLPDVMSRACETEKPRIRNVGLYVHPMSKDISVMTQGASTQDKSCGAEYKLTFRTVGTHCKAKQSTVLIDTSDLKYNRNQSTSVEGLNITKPVRIHSTQTDVVATTENYTVMTETFSTDKATNTPNHLPADVYANFTYSPPVEMLHRASQTDPIYSQAPTAAQTTATIASPADKSESTVRMIYASPPDPSRLPGVVAQGIEVFKSVPVSTTLDCNNLSSNKKVHSATKSTLAGPTTRDQSTSTATLSALLHTERLSIDSMDNKISECINKLRQVTRKLQTSSTDVTRSQLSVSSTNLTDLDFDKSSIAGEDKSIDDASLSSSIPTSPHSRTQSSVHSEPPDVSESRSKPSLPIHRRTRSASNVPETSHTSQRPTLNKVRHADCPPLEYAYPSDPPSFQNVVLLKPKQHDVPTPTHAVVKTELSAVEQMVKTYSRNKTTILPTEPGICYTARPAQSSQATTAASSQTSTRESSPSADQRLKDGGRVVGDGRHARGKSEDQSSGKPASSRSKRWDLKSLVHEEDRLKKRMRGSKESVNERRLNMERRGSAVSNDGASSGMLSATPTTSQYGSTDSLNQLLAGRGPRKAPKVAVKAQKLNKTKNGRKLSPAPSLSSMPTNQRPPALKSTSSAHSSIRADDVGANRRAKARTKTLEPSNLLGYNRSRSGSSSSEKSMKSSANSDTSRRSTNSAKSIVSSVVRKVQSIGRQKSNSGSISPVASPADEEVNKSDDVPPTEYPSKALAERLAHHTLPLPQQNPAQGPPFSPKFSRRKNPGNKTASSRPPWH